MPRSRKSAVRSGVVTGLSNLAISGSAAVGVAVFVSLAHSHGLITLAWGLAANAAISLGLPLAALVLRGDVVLRGVGSAAVLRRLGRFVEGAAVPLALQGLYVVALRFA